MQNLKKSWLKNEPTTYSYCIGTTSTCTVDVIAVKYRISGNEIWRSYCVWYRVVIVIFISDKVFVTRKLASICLALCGVELKFRHGIRGTIQVV